MKKITLLAVALFGAASMSAAPKATETAIKASDSRITYIGRAEVKDGNVSFDWTGVYAKVRFQGNSLSFKVSDTKKNYYNVWLDGSMATTPDKVIAVHGSDTTIVIFTQEELKARFGKDRKAAKAPHQVILQKRTEGEQGTTTISEFITDGEFLQADAPKEGSLNISATPTLAATVRKARTKSASSLRPRTRTSPTHVRWQDTLTRIRLSWRTPVWEYPATTTAMSKAISCRTDTSRPTTW